MKGYTELEIGLRKEGHGWGVEFRVSASTETDLRSDGSLPISLDLAELEREGYDEEAEAYGTRLGKALLGEVPSLRDAFGQARAIAEERMVALRVRLVIWPNASELHGVRWETLRDPDDRTPLFTNENVLFSRYLSSLDWRQVALRPQAQLRSLIAVANPADIASWTPDGRQLGPLPVEAELQRARGGFEGTRVSELGSGGEASLERILAGLREGQDILYLACHGAVVKREAHLLLEDDNGNADWVSANLLVQRIRELRVPPQLAVLVSCQSAGTGALTSHEDAGMLAGLGPRLAEAGVPAVLAMQGNVTVETIGDFMPVFFKELRRDGQIDRAVAAARAGLRGRPDWWAPVLFMRLKSGRIWYTPGFAGGGSGFEKWPSLCRYIESRKCTPIIGPALTDSILGSRQEIAERWAKEHFFPMAPHERDDLPQVAQYLAAQQDPHFPRTELRRYLKRELVARYGGAIGAAVEGNADDILHAVWQRQRADNPVEPHAVLAELPVPIYITTQPTNLLAHALAAAGRTPRIQVCQWHEDVEPFPPEDDGAFEPPEADYRPDPLHPLVYHLFGHLSQPESLVLTEDDYFDYLIGVTNNRDSIPGYVRRALAENALLFLGFRMEDWDFRVLFRSIKKQEGGAKRDAPTHVAVQVDPEEGRTLEPERARRYLESYFQQAERMTLYWGSSDDFARELHDAWTRESAE